MDTNTNEPTSRNEDDGVQISTDANNTNESASRNENANDGHHPFECYICYNPAREPVLTKCGHLFCWPCLYTWAPTPRTCPVCRAKIDPWNVICIQTPHSDSGEGSGAKAEKDSGIPPRPKPSPPPFRKVVDPVVEAMSRDSAHQHNNHVEELASNLVMRRWLIEDLVCSVQLQYDVTPPPKKQRLLDARINDDFENFEAGTSVPDAERPHVIMIKERVEAILRRHDHERQPINKKIDIPHREHEQVAGSHPHQEIAQRHAQEEGTASSQHQEIAQRRGREEEGEEEEDAGYLREEGTCRRGEEEVEVQNIEQDLARIISALEAAGIDSNLILPQWNV